MTPEDNLERKVEPFSKEEFILNLKGYDDFITETTRQIAILIYDANLYEKGNPIEAYNMGIWYIENLLDSKRN